MDALMRQEYPAMLGQLQPGEAVTKLNERVKKIGKVNSEIADWLQERRKIEGVYAASLQKLAKRSLQDVGGHMGVFESPWTKIMAATEDIAKSHSSLSQFIEKDVELPLRMFATTNNEMSSISTMQGNISTIAKEYEDAQDKNERLIRRGDKASAIKIESAANKLKATKQQWEVQAAFVYESLQALDERRINHLRDILTQYQTHEADHIERNRKIVERTLKHLLDVSTEEEIKNWSQSSLARDSTKQNLNRETDSSVLTPMTPSSNGDDQSEHSQPSKSEFGEKKKFRKIGTVFMRRRQSVHSVFRSASPGSRNGFQSFGRGSGSRGGGTHSPRTSSTQLRDSDNRLPSLPESPKIICSTDNTSSSKMLDAASGPGVTVELPPRKSSLNSPNGTTFLETTGTTDTDNQFKTSPLPTGPKENQVDDEGFSIPPISNDPISQTEQEITQIDQPQFKLDIRKEPILEQDSDAEAALSNVANTLRSAQVSPPARKLGTFRGRRDARNTMTMLTGDCLGKNQELPLPTSVPTSPIITPSKVTSLSIGSPSEPTSHFGSDNASIRSGHSLTMQAPIRHPEISSPGLNCSIIETISALFQGESSQSTSITGEIALTYNPTLNSQSSSAPSHETIKIHEISNLEILVPNKLFIQPVSAESTDEFIVNLNPISSKIAVAFTYRMNNSETSKSSIPLLIKSAWKRQNNKLGLVLEYSLNPTFSSTPVFFLNLFLVAHYTGVNASSCQTRPSGVHIKERSLVYWRLGDITLNAEWSKAIALFSGSDKIPEPGHVEARWELSVERQSPYIYRSNIGVSRLEISEEPHTEGDEDPDPFSDKLESNTPTNVVEERNWREIVTIKRLVSGKYSYM